MFLDLGEKAVRKNIHGCPCKWLFINCTCSRRKVGWWLWYKPGSSGLFLATSCCDLGNGFDCGTKYDQTECEPAARQFWGAGALLLALATWAPSVPWPGLGCERAAQMFGLEVWGGCSEVALWGGLSPLVLFSPQTQARVHAGADRALLLTWVLSLAAVFPNGLIVGQEACSEQKMMLFNFILKVNRQSLALPSPGGRRCECSSLGKL